MLSWSSSGTALVLYSRVCFYAQRRWVVARPMQAMGMNAILVFVWHGLATTVINIVYVTKIEPGHGEGGLSGWDSQSRAAPFNLC